MRRVALLLGVAALALASATACGDDDDGDEHADGNTGAVLAAINILDKAGLHDMDTAISKDQKIPANAKTTATRLQGVVLVTEWPSELATEAKALAAVFAEFAAAVDGEKPDLAKAGAAAKKAHDAEHEFSGKVWAHILEEAHIGAGGGDSH